MSEHEYACDCEKCRPTSPCEACGIPSEGWLCTDCEREQRAEERNDAEREEAREHWLEGLEERP